MRQSTSSTATTPHLTTGEYERIRRLVHGLVGIELGPSKQSLVEARLGRRLRDLKLERFDQYLAYLEGDGGAEELVLLHDAISTNVTSFFREPEGLQEIARRHAEAVRKGTRRLRYWSAACSTGEEPYSLAMLLAEAADPAAVDLAILGTDISTRVLAHARRGQYGANAVAKVPADLRRRWFRPVGDVLEVDPRLRALVTCNRMNLIRPPFPMKGPFDAILCRNVMIYFDQPTRQRLVEELCRLLRPGGLLITGQAESLSGRHGGLHPLRPSIYEKR